MVVISAGMQKAGTGWYFNLTNDMLIAAGFQDVRKIREKFNLEHILKYYNCNLEAFTEENIRLLTSPPIAESTFVVKTHLGPFNSLKSFLSKGKIKLTYIYRDPRDVVLSVLDHGKKLREQGQTHSFARFTDFEDTVKWVAEDLLKTWTHWRKLSGILFVRYEDLQEQAEEELTRLKDYLGLTITSEEFQKIALKYDPASHAVYGNRGLHFNKGKCRRYREEMTGEQLRFCGNYFGSYLSEMGYGD